MKLFKWVKSIFAPAVKDTAAQRTYEEAQTPADWASLRRRDNWASLRSDPDAYLIGDSLWHLRPYVPSIDASEDVTSFVGGPYQYTVYNLVTQWLPRSTPPVRTGVYQVQINKVDTGIWYSLYKNGQWHLVKKDAETAAKSKHLAACTVDLWRGLEQLIPHDPR